MAALPIIGSMGGGRAAARSSLVGQRVVDIQAPPEFADAVETYARQYGRHATMRFLPFPLNCWVIEFTLKANDPALLAWREGRLKEEPKEVVHLWEFVPAKPKGREPVEVKQLRQQAVKAGTRLDRYVGYKLSDLGVSGVVAFLEKGNTWGRGRYASHEAAVKEQMDKKAEADVLVAAEAKQNAIDRGMEQRRQALKIPYLGVGIDLKKGPESAPGE